MRVIAVGLIGILMAAPACAKAKAHTKPAPAPAAPAAPPAPNSAWKVETSQSQLDGAKSYIATLKSENDLRNSIGRREGADLFIRCKGKTLEVYVAWPVYMGRESNPVRWKFDDDQIATGWWGKSDNGTATFVTKVRDFLGQLKSSKRLVVSADPYHGTTIEAVFDLAGGDKAANDAASTCGVSL